MISISPHSPRTNRTSIRIIGSLVATLALTAGSAACGASTSADRSASGASGDSVVCPEKRSFTQDVRIRNLLDVPVELRASDIDCNDWSGVSTPPTVFTDQVLEPGEERTFRLEAADNVTRNWTMRFTTSRLELGTVRASMPTGTTKTFSRLPDVVWGTSSQTVRWNRDGTPFTPDLDTGDWFECTITPMARSGAPDTPAIPIRSLWTNATIDMQTMGVIARDGRIALAYGCGRRGPNDVPGG